MTTMEPIRDHFEQQQAPVAGIAKDLRRLKTDGAASAEELRQFIGQFRGRSPNEVMGVVAQSDLFRSIILAAAGCAVLLVALTVVPYAFRDRSSPKASVLPSTVPDTEAAEQSADTGDTNSPAVGDSTDQPDLQRAAKAMGIGDAVPADTDTTPMDDKLEKLLDGID
ncbi:MAG: hypothetical protein CMJ50_07795 [Planctomycetaceae bacterium]|nr:hypothetical protein [Planctomycetaceae bacterium]